VHATDRRSSSGEMISCPQVDEEDNEEEDNEEEDEEDLRERGRRGTSKRDGWSNDIMVDSLQSNTALASQSGRS